MKEARPETPVEDLPTQDVEALLQGSLSQDGLEEVKAIKKEISAVIRWGDLVQGVSGEIFDMVEGICNGDTPELTKSDPINALLGDARRMMENKSDDNRSVQYMVYFLLIKKLLGALKTDINKKISGVRILTDEELETLEQVVADEELLLEVEKLDQTESDAELIARLESGPCPHHKTIVRSNKERKTLETFCKDCRNVIASYQDLGLTVVSKDKKEDGRPAKKKSKECKHRYLSWAPGEEGKVAACVDKEGCPYRVDDPEILQRWDWVKAGLEPFGDDPKEDEVLELCL